MKKYFFVRLVGMIFLLCHFQLNVSAAAASSAAPELISHPVSSLAASKALENIQKYLDFEQDYLDFAKESRSSDSLYFYNVEEIGHNIDDLEEERAFIRGLKIDEKSVDLMLRHFLERRFRILELRQALFHTRRYVDDGSERMKQKDASQVTICQFYDQLIADIYHLISPENLSCKTHWLIRLSPALWPLLKGETEELSHPDLAVYGKLGDKSSIECGL